MCKKGEVNLDKNNLPEDKPSQNTRDKRIKLLKRWIIGIFITLIVLPTILCIIMFFKMNSLQKQIDMIMTSDASLSGKNYKSEELALDFDISNKTANNQIDLLGLENVYSANLFPMKKVIQSSLLDLNKEENKEFNQEQNHEYQKENQEVNQEVNQENQQENIEEKQENKEVDQKDSQKEEQENTPQVKNQDKSQDKNTVNNSKSSETNKSDSSETKKDDNEDNNQEDTKKEVTVTTDNTKTSNTKTKINSNINYKKVYLTFDDGPSKYTSDILDLLNEYGVKATFFVIGKTDDNSLKMYKRIVEEGHSLGMHSYSHNYHEIYNSLKDFKKDFKKIRKLLYDVTGQSVNIYRFPGGSGNTVSNMDMSVYIKYLHDQSVTYFDWNVVNGDATGKKLTVQQMYENVINGVKIHNRSIVLMHDTDTKEHTIETLTKILDYLTQEGIEILPLNEKVDPIQQVKLNSILHKR